MFSTSLRFAIVAMLFFSSNIIADETYLCTYGQNERIISIIYQNQESKLPCEVRYKKEGMTNTLWSSKNKIGFCEDKAQNFVQKQVDWGWRCGNTTTTDTPIITNPNTLTSSQINLFKYKAHFSRAISTATPFKLQSNMYANQEGEFPKRLEDIGFRREQMRTSREISDLKIDNGKIKIKGNKQLGESTVIILTPRITLGGASIEWNCSTNVNINDQEFCKFDPNSTFE